MMAFIIFTYMQQPHQQQPHRAKFGYCLHAPNDSAHSTIIHAKKNVCIAYILN